MPEIFRYRRQDEIRIYHLRVVTGGTELWRVTVRPGQLDAEIKEDGFTSEAAALRYFEEVERALIAGGWREVGVPER
jgi:hypothetical protein